MQTGAHRGTMFPRVLLPTDFSPHAERTVQCIAEVPGIEDLLLHVLEARDNSTSQGQHTLEAPTIPIP